MRLINNLGDDGNGGQSVTYSKASIDTTRNIDGTDFTQGEKFLVGDIPSVKEIQAERMVDDQDQRIYGAVTVITAQRQDLTQYNKNEYGIKKRTNRYGEILIDDEGYELSTAQKYVSGDGQICRLEYFQTRPRMIRMFLLLKLDIESAKDTHLKMA